MKIDRMIVQGVAALAMVSTLAILVVVWWLARETGATEVVEWAIDEQVKEARRVVPPPSSDHKPKADTTYSARRTDIDGNPLPLCPARLVVEDQDGNPLAGEAKIGLPPDPWKTLDEDGTAEWSSRYCDLKQSVHLKFPDGSKSHQRVPFEDGNEVFLVVPKQRTAWLLPVDAAGDPVEATVRPGKALEDGRYRLTGRHPQLRVTLARPGEHGRPVMVDLDETTHKVEVQPDREVWITLHCDQCSGWLTCEDNWLARRKCLGEGELYSCPCPATDATLWLHTPDSLLDYRSDSQPLAMVPADAETLTVDVRGELGAIRICIGATNQRLHGFALQRPGTRSRKLSIFDSDLDDGCYLVDGLLPGHWLVRSSHAAAKDSDSSTVQPVVVRSGETREVRFNGR